MELINKYNKINKISDINNNKYYTDKIFENKNHRIGKTKKNLPIVLIKVKSSNVEPSENLSKFVSISYSSKCLIQSDKNEFTDYFCTIELLEGDEYITEIFLSSIEKIIEIIDDNIEINQLKKIITDFLNLWRSFNKSKSNIIGLWGELFLILSSKNSEALIESWREKNKFKYDFFNINGSIEVKTTSTNQRMHKFRHAQLIEKVNNVLVASILIQKKENGGFDIYELQEKINDKINNPKLKSKLYNGIYEIIGSQNKDQVMFHKYDYDYSIKHTRYYYLADLPKVLNYDRGVEDIEYSVNLEYSKHIENFEPNSFFENLTI